MAELEALAEIKTTTGGHLVPPGQYTWRYSLPENKLIRLGSDPSHSEWVVPEDRMISRFHATLEWDGSKLVVAKRPITPEYPNPPQNHIWFRNSPVAEQCEVRPGEWFVIGQTRFALRGDGEAAPPSPVDATVVQRQAEYTRAELEKLTFSDPATVLKAMEQIPNCLRMVTTEALLFRQILRVALAGLPKADAVGIVRALPDGPRGEPRLAVIEQNVRPSQAILSGEFIPSRKLVRQAYRDRKSCLRVWSSDPADIDPGAAADHTLTLGVMFQSGVTPWAVCTPFQDGSPFALYISGRVRSEGPTAKIDSRLLTDYQKFAEILIGLVESTRRTLKVIRQNQLLQAAWPTALRRYLDDPDRLETMLRPREADVTVLFCDIRNFAGFAEEHGSDLTQAWREIQWALDTMSAAITEKGGIVAGFRGDAVLGFWGWPEGGETHLRQAAAAALLIRERLHGWMLQKRCGLGVTHGRAVAGRLGAHDLGVVDLYGPVVNLAFRLEEMTKAFGIGVVVSDVVANRLAEIDPNGLEWRTRLLGLVRPRGMKEPLRAYELSPTTGDSWLTSEWYVSHRCVWNDAVEQFIAGDWDAAREQFLERFEGDPVAECILRHMDRTRGKPPANWDGAYTPTPPSVI